MSTVITIVLNLAEEIENIADASRACSNRDSRKNKHDCDELATIVNRVCAKM